MLKYDVVEVAPFTFELRDKQTGKKVNLTDRFRELEAQGHFDGKKK